MVSETPNLAPALLPERHPQYDLFICDVSDAVLKDVMPQMEHPFYSLSKKPETSIRRYEHNGQWLQVTPSVKGLATIYDKDVLIYCISQIMAKIKAGEPVSKRVRINSRDLLIFTNRGTAGKDYEALQEAIERIRGTTISTNIRTGDEEQTDTFGLIDASSIRRKHGLDGRLISCEITLSDWVFNAIRHNEVLTLHRDYFRLRKPLERRMYELARKHCGQQDEWAISLDLLRKKTGSASSDKEFRRLVGDVCDENAKYSHMPDYSVRLDGNNVRFTNRKTMKALPSAEMTLFPTLDPETYNDARIVAPGYDVYYLEQEWRNFWLESGKPELKNPDAAFIGFCKSRHNKKPMT